MQGIPGTMTVAPGEDGNFLYNREQIVCKLVSIKGEKLAIGNSFNRVTGLLEAKNTVILDKDKDLESKYKVTKEVVSEAYPDITWGGRS